MFQLTMQASTLGAIIAQNKPKLTFSYAKTKENLTKLFQEHHKNYEKEKDNPENKLMNIPQSFINTAFTLTQLFIAEFQKGKVRNGEIRVCKSYIQGHMVGSKLSIRTIDRHIDRLKDFLSIPFIKEKSRSTLGDIVPKGSDRNCIAISFEEGVIHSEITKENFATSESVEKKPSYPQSTINVVVSSEDNSAFWAAEIAKNLKNFDSDEAQKA